ncbi:MAG: hypothetical protein U1F43_32310 [Myxococcota bacterium]
MAWLVSGGGAIAFLGGGYLLGRSRSSVASPPTPPAPLVSAPAPRSDAPPRERPTTRPSPRPAVASRPGATRDEQLVQVMRALDPLGSDLSSIVLVDASGLPLASTDERVDPTEVAAIAAQALGLLTRVGELVAPARGLSLDLDGGRVLDIRPIAPGEQPYLLVSAGARRPDDTRFRDVASRLTALLAG